MPKDERIRDRGMEEPTERDLLILDNIRPEGSSVRDLLSDIGVPDNFQIREAFIGLLTILEGKGFLRKTGARPATWVKTFRGREA
ncbi:hypothetical protein LCGC14_0840150 [marine sediment metagenome]|uniref:Uncharacterized protein n=1 Tax=marine sediment metagenome TaxID=412755 RepID=A0A0F9PYN8_9ZZZZ